VLVHLDQLAIVIVNADHSNHVNGCGCIWFTVPQMPEWQRITDQIDPTMIFARTTS
jgi:hypothetical protein